MNNKKVSKIKFNKRQIWQVAFTAMTASALMAVDQQEGQQIVGAVEKEVPELVRKELEKVMKELGKRIIKSTVEEIKQEQGMLIQWAKEEATLRMRTIEEIEEIGRTMGQVRIVVLEMERLEIQEEQRALSEVERLRNSQLEAEAQILLTRLRMSMARSEEQRLFNRRNR